MADQGKEDVASTLNELERKLRALESDLESAVAEPAAPAAPPAPVEPSVEPEPVIQAPIIEPGPIETVIPTYELPAEPPVPTTPSLGDGDPEQIVSEARHRISDLRAELDELARTREQIAQTANELVSGYNRALAEPPPEPAPPEPAPPIPPAPPVAPPIAPPAPLQQQPPPPAAAPIPQPLPPEHTIQHGAVAIDAGFFRDLTSLSAFEQSIARVPGVVGVHVRGFAQGRAIIDVQLSHPIPLGAELARHAPLRFTVTEAGPAHLMLAIAG